MKRKTKINALLPQLATLRAEPIKDIPTASMNEVVMSKSELIEKLVENKGKHDAVLAAAIAGYWNTAKSKVEEKQKQLDVLVKEFTEETKQQLGKVLKKVEGKEILPTRIDVRNLMIDSSLNLVYPEDHSKDYDKAINMMKSSIYDNVKLSSDEYDAYVLNNWEWKSNFLGSNSSYIKIGATSLNNLQFTGSYIDNSVLSTKYRDAGRTTLNELAKGNTNF